MIFRNIKLYFILSIFVLCFVNSYAICLNTPSSVKVTSGSNLVGTFNSAYLSGGDLIYIKENLDSDPLKVDIYFDDIDNDCFSTEDDVQMRLLSAGIYISADSISTSGNSTIAKFTFDIATIVPSSFNSNVLVKHKNNVAGTDSVIHFGTDDEAPVFNDLTKDPDEVLIQSNTTIEVQYEVEDTKSGLDSLKITGGIAKIINFDNNETYSSSISETLTSSRTYIFTVTDKLGNQRINNVSYIVDAQAPVLDDFSVDSYSKNDVGTRKVTFSVEVEDISYTVDNTLPDIKANFSELNGDLNVIPDCVRDSIKNDMYVCTFEDVDITKLNDTTTINIVIDTQDVLGNTGSYTFSKEIFYDTQGPVINDFYLENGAGEQNIFNALDDDAIIVVDFTDESAEDKNDITLYPVFDGIEFTLIPDCSNITNYQGRCVWELGNTLSKYSGVETDNITYKLTIVDVYGNPTTEYLNLTINNKKPVITDIKLIETTDIKDHIVNSDEKINFQVFISGTYMKFDEDFIYGDFSNIDYRNGMDQKAASCNYYNESLIQCDFTGIVVENGYMKKNISFVVTDTSGNTIVEPFEVEVFAVGDEVFSSFKIEDISILNILDRNVVMNAGLDAWFEGDLILQPGNDDIKVVNYQLKSCNDSDMNPVLIGERTLYPEEVVIAKDSSSQADKHFILKAEVETHPNEVDLVTDKMKCTMSVLKRDDEKVYPAELVEFYIEFDYFELPYDNVIAAYADKALTYIDDISFLEGWFDMLYSLYEIFDKVCGIFNGINGIVSTIGQAWYSISMAMHATPAAGAASITDDGVFGIQGMSSKLRHGLGESGIGEDFISPITTMCSWVECSSGTWLQDFWADTLPDGIKGASNAWGLLDFSNMCSEDISSSDGSDSGDGGDIEDGETELDKLEDKYFAGDELRKGGAADPLNSDEVNDATAKIANNMFDNNGELSEDYIDRVNGNN